MKKITNIILLVSLLAVSHSIGQVNIFVNQGGFTNPPYSFALDEAFTEPFDINAGGSDALDINETYIFLRANNATSHPFYISDQGAFNEPETISLLGDGSITSGINGEQSFTLIFDTFDPATNTLTYYCTVHSSMVGTFNVIPEPATYASIMGILIAGMVLCRRKQRC